MSHKADDIEDADEVSDNLVNFFNLLLKIDQRVKKEKLTDSDRMIVVADNGDEITL